MGSLNGLEADKLNSFVDLARRCGLSVENPPDDCQDDLIFVFEALITAYGSDKVVELLCLFESPTYMVCFARTMRARLTSDNMKRLVEEVSDDYSYYAGTMLSQVSNLDTELVSRLAQAVACSSRYSYETVHQLYVKNELGSLGSNLKILAEGASKDPSYALSFAKSISNLPEEILLTLARGVATSANFTDLFLRIKSLPSSVTALLLQANKQRERNRRRAK